MNEWDYAFLVLIGVFSVLLIVQLHFYFTHLCPTNETGMYIGGDWVCIDSRFIENNGGVEYLFSLSFNDTGPLI